MRLIWFLLLVALSIPVFANDGLHINMKTCEPSGITGRAKAALNPLEFWVGEYVALGILLEDRDAAHDRELCRTLATDRKGYQECLQYNQEYWSRVLRCKSIAQQRCRSLGGRC